MLRKMLLIVVAWSGLIATPQAFAYEQIEAGVYHTCGRSYAVEDIEV
jgi:hypothetical protein